MKILRIIKINFLALAATPILLIRILAALAKLVADALGIVFSAFRIAALFAGMVLVFISFRTSDWTLEKVEVCI